MMPLPPKSQPSPMTAQLPTVALRPASHSASCANLSDCANENSVAEGLETYDVGEYHLTACPICLEHFTLDNPAILLKCEHGFHLQCLESWRQRSSVCPMCFTPMAGDEGRIMSPADARRRRRMRFKTPAGTIESPERSVLIDGSVSAACGSSGCRSTDDCGVAHAQGQDEETEVIVVASADQDPHSWRSWMCCCCCLLF